MGTMYRTSKSCKLIGTVDSQVGTVPLFGVLCDIIVYGEERGQVLFIFNAMETLWYDFILGAYEVMLLAEYQCRYRASLQCFNAVEHDRHTQLDISMTLLSIVTIS